MNCLTLADLKKAGHRLEIECLRCGGVEYRSPASVCHEVAALTAVAALGLQITCRLCGAQACITSPAPVAGQA